jgi:predicted Zn-dependent protease
VHRIGMALVPAYQRAMADDDPSKIHFRFFAVDDAKMRTEICLLDGAVLVPKQVVERLKSDDQLAAVLANGVAYNLQRQAARAVIAMRKDLGVEIAIDVASALVTGGIAAFGPGVFTAKEEATMEEERLRISLALMRDAGYDPWQAPEAWRLLEPKKLPADLASLPYPDAGCYQIGILNLQYARK